MRGLCYVFFSVAVCTALGACGATVSEPSADPLCVAFGCDDTGRDTGPPEADGEGGFDGGTFDDAGSEADAATSGVDEVPLNFAELCPDGFLDRHIVDGQETYGRKRVPIPPGTIKRYCARVEAPLVPDSATIDRIFLSFNDEPDFVCAAVTATMQQAFPPYKTAGPSTGTSGSIRFLRKVFHGEPCPECVARGVYVVTLEGHTVYNPSVPTCELFNFAWGWND